MPSPPPPPGFRFRFHDQFQALSSQPQINTNVKEGLSSLDLTLGRRLFLRSQVIKNLDTFKTSYSKGFMSDNLSMNLTT